jgi:hypothetical protein
VPADVQAAADAGTKAPVPVVAPPGASAQLVTLDIASLTQLIAGVVTQQLTSSMGGGGLSNAGLADAIAAGIAGSTRRRKTFGEYVATVGNYYHPVVSATVHFTPNRKYFQNDAEFMHSNLFDQEVSLLNRLTHSGRYLNRLIEVGLREEDGHQVFNLRYSNKSAGMNAIKEQLFRQPGDKSTLATILRQIVEAQEAEDRETADLLEARQARRVELQEARA